MATAAKIQKDIDTNTKAMIALDTEVNTIRKKKGVLASKRDKLEVAAAAARKKEADSG